MKYQSVEQDVLDFFHTFARFEFALKECGYVAGSRNGNAMPDWNKFIKNNNVKSIYFTGHEISKVIDDLLKNLPHRQKVKENEEGQLLIYWERYELNDRESCLKILVDIIKIIRNNLFHGGKYGDKGWDDVERVKFLLRSASLIIKHWISCDEDINVYFNDLA